MSSHLRQPLPAAEAAAAGAAHVQPAWLRIVGQHVAPETRGRSRQIALTAFGVGAVGLFIASLLFALEAAAGPSDLSPELTAHGPAWLAGVFRGVLAQPSQQTVATLENWGLPLMFVAFLLAVSGARHLRARAAFAIVAVTLVARALGPSGPLNDEFSYLELARMWAQFHLSPYSNVINQAPHAGLLFQLSAWRSIPDTYGPLFTMVAAPVSMLPLAAAYWTLRALTVGVCLLTVWLCGCCAEELDVSPAAAMVFLGLNPVTIFYGVGGAHNDWWAIAAVMGALLLILRSRRPTDNGQSRDGRWRASEQLSFAAGVLLMVACGMKSSAVVCAPVMLVACRRRFAMVSGLLCGGIALWLITAMCFGGVLPDITQQKVLSNIYSVGSIVGVALGFGGETGLLALVLDLVMVVIIVWSVVRVWRSHELVAEGVAWSTIGLTVGLAAVFPHYALWFLAPAAVARSRTVKIVSVVLALVLVLAQLPDAQWLIGSHEAPLNLLHLNVSAGFFN